MERKYEIMLDFYLNSKNWKILDKNKLKKIVYYTLIYFLK